MTSKLTRDIIQSEIADFFAGVVEIHTELGGPNTAEEAQNQLTERVLACVPVVDSEPYGFTDGDHRGMIYEPQYADRLNKPIPVYRHAQQPVVLPVQHWEELCREYPDMSIRDAIIRAAWWNHCRAAMLQAGNSPVIPDGYVMVPKEPTPEILATITEAIRAMRGSAATYARVLAAAPQEVQGE